MPRNTANVNQMIDSLKVRKAFNEETDRIY